MVQLKPAAAAAEQIATRCRTTSAKKAMSRAAVPVGRRVKYRASGRNAQQLSEKQSTTFEGEVPSISGLGDNSMINRHVLQELLATYKRDFATEIWPLEKYKWQAVQHFQEHWQPDTPDFPNMLSEALSRTENLLASAGNFPKDMIVKLANAEPERVHQMFAALFDEDVDVVDRIEEFKQEATSLLETDSIKSHFQDENTITTYLWLRYPDKYYIYKWSEARKISEMLAAGYRFKQGDYANNVRDHLAMYNQICDVLQEDPNLREMLDALLTPDCYPDPKLHTLTIDVGYWMSHRPSAEVETEPWWPTRAEYDPGLSTADWERLLSNEQVFPPQSLKIMKRLKDVGGAASLVELSDTYGSSTNFYNSGSQALARRVIRTTDCSPPPEELGQNSKLWPVLYQGRPAKPEERGSYIWRLRDDLSAALDRVDLSHVPLYEPGPATNGTALTTEADAQDRNYWWLIASPTQIFRFDGLSVGGIEPWPLRNNAGNLRLIHQNFLEVNEGDLVIGYESSPTKAIIALGEISAPQDGENIYFKKTEALASPVKLAEIKEIPELQHMEALSTNMRGTLFKLTGEEYEAIIDLVRESNLPNGDSDYPLYSKEDFLAEVYVSETKYDQMVNVLERKKNIIVQGPPGVGKTFLSNRLAWSIMGEKDDSRIEFVQFHQNYSYEDFVEGYKPTDEGFELRKGIFTKFCTRAANNPDVDYFFLIDEINRGNLSKVFGELLMLIENSYRGRKITLPYSGSLFSVPENVHIVGMMNTADRSLALIDYALRRRFSFVSMTPGFSTAGFTNYQRQHNNESFDRLLSLIRDLNLEIAKDPSLGSGFCIGHSYFTEQESITASWLQSVIDYDIVPMLEEYWFDDQDKVEGWRNRLHGVLQP